ncbi:MAG: M13 family peptidase [Clostridiaceae bacterium]|nr:M13 family peptidase [Clostridiaceae bacterium]
MIKTKQRVLGLILCLAILFGQVSVMAATETEYVTREKAVASILEVVGLGALSDTSGDLSIFTDASEISSEYEDMLSIAVSNGIIFGSGNALLPKKYVTRLEFALFISRSIREFPGNYMKLEFSDVPEAFTGDISRLASSGVMVGYGNGLFGAEDYLTHTQLEAVLMRIKSLAYTRPQDDFFYSINHEWLRNTRLPQGYPGMTSFDEVNISNNNKLKNIVNEVVVNSDSWEAGSKEQKIADFYKTIVDIENRNKQGIEPILPYLTRLYEADTAQKLLSVLVEFEDEIGLNPLFTFSPSIDFVDSSRYKLYGSGLSTVLPTAYLIMENPQIITLYQGLIGQIQLLAGISEDIALKNAQDIYTLELLLAQNSMSNEEASKIENVYNVFTLDEIEKMFPSVDIKSYIIELGYEDVEEIIITDPDLMIKTGEIFSDENLDILKTYAIYRMVISTASYLSKDMEYAINAFNSTFLGIDTQLSEEDIAFNLVNSVMSSYLGRIYVEEYFSAAAKNDVEDIVNEIISKYQERLENLEWMSESTKKAAISKLNKISLKIGYPDTWDDPLRNIEIKSYEDGGSLLGNILEITAAQTKYSKTLLSEEVDKSGWIVPPHMVNAFYNATSNEIIFPAGILQAPFYDVNASREQNLGGIGTIIAHEITHAFDNNGAQFDENGNLSIWWTEEDYTAFMQKCNDVIKLFDGLEIAPDCIVNGSLTVSENVADIGAMACILDIAKDMPNADYEKLFESYANIWRMTATNKYYQMLTLQDTHAPNKLRVNQVLKNFEEFYETYNVQPDDDMYLAPEDRVIIW